MAHPELHEPEQQDFRSAVARGVYSVRRLLQNQGVQEEHSGRSADPRAFECREFCERNRDDDFFAVV